MIKIKVCYQDNYIKKVTLKGHANYSNYGQDIVCSAVSSTYLTTINGIISLNNNIKATNSEVNVITNDDVTNKLLINMINMLEELSHNYPKNIHIDKEEI